MNLSKICLLSVVLCAFQSIVAAGEVALFNGKNLDGWTVFLDPKTQRDAVAGDVFRARDGVLAVSGSPYGFIRTTGVYDHFRLHVEWRYPAKAGNSGILLFVQEELKLWPACVESQLEAGNAGDFVIIGAIDLERPAGVPAPKVSGEVKFFAKFKPSNEKPIGEWNSADIVCEHGAVTVRINGELQNRALRTGLQSGHIALQSEGAPIEFRNIRLTPLK
jgi:hypothetical protein